jgi:hypothetical protein
MTLAIYLFVIAILIGMIAQFINTVDIQSLKSRVKIMEAISLDTYKDHHEHILLANRDKNCYEEVSSKTDPKFIRTTKENGKPGAFIPQDRKTHGPCTRTEAKQAEG